MSDKRQEAILLLGPTAAGKTPLGHLLELRGVDGRRCLHFDFGENLRRIVRDGRVGDIVSDDDVAYLRGVLRRGELLKDEDFPIARRIFESFLVENAADAETLIVLNGLPRHKGQARGVAVFLHVLAVVYLRCSAETVLQRVALNTGGDRHGRTDDDLEAVRRKLVVFQQQTEPLVEYYREVGTQIVMIEVGGDTTPEQMWESLNGVLRGRG